MLRGNGNPKIKRGVELTVSHPVPGLVLAGTCTLEMSELTLGTLGEEAGTFFTVFTNLCLEI